MGGSVVTLGLGAPSATYKEKKARVVMSSLVRRQQDSSSIAEYQSVEVRVHQQPLTGSCEARRARAQATAVTALPRS